MKSCFHNRKYIFLRLTIGLLSCSGDGEMLSQSQDYHFALCQHLYNGNKKGRNW